MKAIYKTILLAAAVTPLLTGCIEEVMPTKGLVQSQLSGSSDATSALVYALPGHLNTVGSVDDQHWDIGFGAAMIRRDLFTADYVHSSLGANYDHFWYAAEDRGLSQDLRFSPFPWVWNYKHIDIANKVIAAIDENTTDPNLKWMLASGYAWRAWTYLDSGREYEGLPTDGYVLPENLVGLTVPIVTEKTTEEEVRSNPRVSHDVLVEFIRGDLDKAIAISEGANAVPSGKTIPSLAVIYGLYARLCLWDASYQEEINSDAAAARALYTEAKKYAELAISTHGGHPLTRDEWLDKSSGFNSSDFSSWMLCGQYVGEDIGVQAPNVSWTGWVATEKSYGYSSTRLRCFPEIGASLYNRMSDRDFRKLSYVAPEGSTLSGQEPFIDQELADTYFEQPYISIKFRPGSGSVDNGRTGCKVAYPLMRVEEMYFISIECDAHLDAAAGKNALVSFMKQYRNSSYVCMVDDQADVIEEIIFQKRVELWGEGLAMFDIKRLDYPVIRFYDGTNFYSAMLMNTSRRPCWMNLCVPRSEVQANQGISADTNNPDPSDRYTILN